MTACQPCASGPVGIDGHEGLFLHETDHGEMRFKCRACDCIWIRRYAGQGSFAWVLGIGLARGSELAD